MKIAVISDIHGNLEAMNRVLKDIKKRNIDKIFCLGDIILKGTHMKECLDLVRKNCEIVIQGNCDEVFSHDNFNFQNNLERKKYEWVRSKLEKKDFDYLLNLPKSYEFYMSGRLIRLFHATPGDIYGYVGNIDKLDNLYSLFLPSKYTSNKICDVVIYGHIHTQYMQKIYNRTIINVGSVGNSLDVIRNSEKDGNNKNTTCADYLVINGKYNFKDYADLSFEFINLEYDIDKELNSNTDNFEFESYSHELKCGKYRDIAKVKESLKKRDIDYNKI